MAALSASAALATARALPVHNFSAGPSLLPPSVIERVSAEVRHYEPAGGPLPEIRFTGPAFGDLIETAEADLRALMDIPSDYAVLFMAGGATAQFSLLPLNLLGARTRASYVDSGYWSRRALQEGRRYCSVQSLDADPDRLPERVASESAYCHITSNETVDGWAYAQLPRLPTVPLVADMSSDFLARAVTVSDFGLIYASAQKNLGATGLAIVIVRRDLLGRAASSTPAVFDYTRQSAARSLLNTPPTFAVYLTTRMLQWVRANGGVAAMERASLRKSARLYDAIDASAGFYVCTVPIAGRSRINVCFTLRDEALTAVFLRRAQQEGFMHLAGHSQRGGIRASLYNALPDAAVSALAEFMRDFARRRG